jgi:hypothetical protein
VRPLVAVRRSIPFDPRFIGRHPLLWPLARAVRAIEPLYDFPPIQTLQQVFDPANGVAPVRFAPAAPRRRRGKPLDARGLYDARIALDREVPTRPHCWHDLMNALVWGTFPRSKQALHVRQHRAISDRLTPGARTLPPTRSRELDALALVDEGGVALIARTASQLGSIAMRRDRAILDAGLASGAVEAVVFGHAIYESLVLGVKPAVVAAVLVVREEAEADTLRAVDRGLARVLADSTRLRSPEELVRIDLDRTRPVPPFT